jgi:hypothetical protein
VSTGQPPIRNRITLSGHLGGSFFMASIKRPFLPRVQEKTA